MAIVVKPNGEADVIEPIRYKGPDASVPRNPKEPKMDTTKKDYIGGFAPSDSVPTPVRKNTTSDLTGETSGGSASSGGGGNTSSGGGTSEGSTAASGGEVSAKYTDLMNRLGQTYDSKWDEQIADLYNQIVQRKSFNYNSEDDMLFQMYKQRYTDQGKQAMRDTIGQTAALTGGYGNSYGQAVGQQTYDEYLKGLYDLLPEFFDRAYQRYAQEGDRLTQLYSLASDMDARDYSRFQGEQGQAEGIFKILSDAAAVRGAAGDFGGYEDLFGTDSADRMEFLFNAQTLMPLYEAGYIDAEKYKAITGEYPVGYKPRGGGGSGGGGWGGSSGGGGKEDYQVINSAGGVHTYDGNTGEQTSYVPLILQNR